MDPALKQRLLGAAVLIALAVVFVPMFFPGAPSETESAAVSLDIPEEPGSELKSQVFELDVPARPAGSETSAPAFDLPAPIGGQAPPPVAAQSSPTPEVNGTEITAEQPKPDVEIPATAKTAAPVGTAAAPRFAISLGVFAQVSNADARLAKAKLLGYPAYMETVQLDGKSAHGVRVGPFNGRASAEAARLRLKAEMPGDKPSLVVLDGSRSKDAPASAVASNAAGGWAVQLAASRSHADALKLRDQARKAGFEAFVDDTKDSKGTWWRVRVGPRALRADAEKLKQAVKQKLGKDGLVVTHP